MLKEIQKKNSFKNYLLPFQTLNTWALRPYIFLGLILASFTFTTKRKQILAFIGLLTALLISLRSEI